MNTYKQIWKSLAEDIQEEIINGHYKPDERLKENELAVKFSISNTPVREALRYLERIGFVEIVPRTGARVKGIKSKEIENLFTIQSVLEELAVRKAVPKLSESDYKELKHYLDRIEKNYREGNYPEFEKANVGFHSTIWKAADNEDLIEMLGNIYERVKRFRSVTRSYPDKTRDVVNPHKEILEAVMEKDSRKAGKLVRRHLQRYVEDVVAMLERQPD